MKLSKRTWINIIMIGLMGQFAWTIENMYFNVFLYNTISTDPTYIANMVSASAIVATLTTLFMGALSDKLGKRKLFITAGYILWGLSTLAFRFITVENMMSRAVYDQIGIYIAMAARLVVIMDCVMTFFGSTANDAAYNAYITDVTDGSNRGRVESVLATLPLISMLVIFGAFDPMTQQGKWAQFFTIFGLAITAVGIISLFTLEESAPRTEGSGYFKNIFYGFSPSVIKENRMLYISLCALGIYSISVQVFFPYLIIYLQNYLNMDNYAIVLGVVLIFASVVSIVSGKFIDQKGKMNFIMPAAAIMFAGLLGMFLARTMIAVIVAGAVMMSGYMLLSASLSGTVRDYTPEGKAGLFQGIRMIFAVLLPMVTGPYIGAAVIKNNTETYTDLGVVKNVPTPAIFLAAAAVLALVLIPVILLKRNVNKNTKDI